MKILRVARKQNFEYSTLLPNFTPTMFKSQTVIHKGTLCLINGFSCHVDDTCSLMEYYAA